jgi:hypothetical protein
MNEVEKMYKLANVQPQYKKRIECKEGHSIGQPCGKSPCIDCDKSVFENVMPPFTEKKQLEIVKFLLNKSVYYDTYGDREYWFHLSDEIENSKYREFDEAIAECIYKMWEDLRDYEKVQIKEILE